MEKVDTNSPPISLMPDLAFELEAWSSGYQFVAGIDEAGRGPLAGPVVAAAVVFHDKSVPDTLIETLDDSKRLTAKRRDDLFDVIPLAADVSVGQADVAEIDEINILQATLLAMRRAAGGLGRRPDFALVDGNQPPELTCPCQTIVKGDSRSLSIAAASIIAKVTRDRMMDRLAAKYPDYGWQTNRGYGTAEHRSAIERFGITPHHRTTFAPINNMLSPRLI